MSCVVCGAPCKRGAKAFCSHACRDVRSRAADPTKRFWTKVNRTDGCWLWTGNLFGKGYGQFGYQRVPGQRRHIGAHVYSYILAHGPVPDGMEVMHLCHVKRCVRPDHLQAGTHLENIRASVVAGHFVQQGNRKPKKLTDQQVQEILALHRSGIFQNSLAQRFGVSTTLVCQLVNGQTRPRVTQAVQPHRTVEGARGESSLRRVG